MTVHPCAAAVRTTSLPSMPDAPVTRMVPEVRGPSTIARDRHVGRYLLAREEREHILQRPRLEFAALVAVRTRLRGAGLGGRQVDLAQHRAPPGEHRGDHRWNVVVRADVVVTESVGRGEKPEVWIADSGRGVRPDEVPVEDVVLRRADGVVAVVVQDEDSHVEPVVAQGEQLLYVELEAAVPR